MKKIILSALIFASIASANEQQSVDIPKMNISSLLSKTINSATDCIEYCVDGISIYAIFTPWGVKYYKTPNVSHNSPDIIVMTHNDIRDTPWEEFDDFFGKSYTNMSEKILQGTFSSDMEMGGGRERHEGWGKYQANAMKEVVLQGHPASIITSMFGSSGLKAKGYYVGRGDDRYWHQCKTYGCIEEDNSALGNSVRQETGMGGSGNMSTERWLTNFQKGRKMNTTPDMVDAFGGNIKNVESVAGNRQLNGLTRSIGGGASRFGKMGGNLFCKSNITPFMPYYLSGLDGVQWRMGYPVSDAKYSQYILNPLSSDAIGATVKDNNGLTVNEEWGYLFPREGVVNNDWDSKRGLIVAARGAHILNENNSHRVRYKPNKSNNGFGGWGKIFPVLGDTTPGQTKSACHKNIANTGITNNESGGYAWTFWRRYNCDLRTVGMYVTTIKFPKPVCLTKKVPQ